MIIDTHTHFGEPSRPNDLLYRTELPVVYEELAVPEGVTGTVVVEARMGLEEIAWLSGLAEDDPFIVGIVGDVEPSSETFAADLESVAGNPLLVGVRYHDRCCRDDRAAAASATDAAWRRTLQSAELLAARDMELDLHITHKRIDLVIELAMRVPELRLVVNHIAENRPLEPKGVNSRWAEDIHRLGEYPRVYCKVSNLVQITGLHPVPADVGFYAPTLDVLWETFGEDRLIYGSNWPQIERASDFATAQRIVAEYFGSKGQRASEQFFWQNAQDVYKWPQRD